MQDAGKLITCRINPNYTTAVILQLSELFICILTLNFQHERVGIFRDCLCIKIFYADTVILKQIFLQCNEQVFYKYYDIFLGFEAQQVAVTNTLSDFPEGQWVVCLLFLHNIYEGEGGPYPLRYASRFFIIFCQLKKLY